MVAYVRCPKFTVHYFGRLFLIDQLPAGKIAVYVFLEMIALGLLLKQSPLLYVVIAGLREFVHALVN